MFYACTLFGQNFKNKQVLVYTKNGKGYVHDNIPNAIKCFDSLAQVLGYKITKSADPSVFTDPTLKKTDLIIFASTNNDVFDTDDQRLAFRHYIEAGGTFFGIHSILGTERNWTWFKQMMGGLFAWHPKFQSFDILKIDAKHPTVQTLPDKYSRMEEFYFMKELYPVSHTLLVGDIQSLHPDTTDLKKIEINKSAFDRYYPISWENYFDGGHVLITTLGHDKNEYLLPQFSTYLKENIRYLLNNSKIKNYKLIHSTNRDDLPKNLQ